MFPLLTLNKWTLIFCHLKLLVTEAVEEWLSALLQEVKNTICKSMKTAIESIKRGVSVDEIVMNNCCQVGLMTFWFYWTINSEKAVNDIRDDRKSFVNMNKKYLSITNRLIQMIYKGTWKSGSITLSQVQNLRLESIIGVMFVFSIFIYFIYQFSFGERESYKYESFSD